MISYLLATIPWTFGCIALSPPNPTAIKCRKYVSGAFYGSIIPLIYFFIQHKVHRVAGGKWPAEQGKPGDGLPPANPTGPAQILTDILLPSAYTTYAFFEWSLVLLDVAFDAVTALDFDSFEVVIRDIKGVSKGYVHWLPK